MKIMQITWNLGGPAGTGTQACLNLGAAFGHEADWLLGCPGQAGVCQRILTGADICRALAPLGHLGLLLMIPKVNLQLPWMFPCAFWDALSHPENKKMPRLQEGWVRLGGSRCGAGAIQV